MISRGKRLCISSSAFPKDSTFGCATSAQKKWPNTSTEPKKVEKLHRSLKYRGSRPINSVSRRLDASFMEVCVEKIGQILRELCQQKGVELLEGKAIPDHIHLLLSVPPKYSITMTVGYPITACGVLQGTCGGSLPVALITGLWVLFLACLGDFCFIISTWPLTHLVTFGNHTN